MVCLMIAALARRAKISEKPENVRRYLAWPVFGVATEVCGWLFLLNTNPYSNNGYLAVSPAKVRYKGTNERTNNPNT